MKTLAIIGTAGRKTDAAKLTIKHWNTMCRAAQHIISTEQITNLVSGGAAWADHVAVRMHERLAIPLKLWLPAKEADLEIAKYYHSKFSRMMGKDTYKEVIECSDIERFGGFKDRNTKVAEAADLFLAITFGEGARVKDGGTLDTVNKMQKRGAGGYHLDLNSLKLYSI